MHRWIYRLGLLGCVLLSVATIANAADAKKVLYFTHEPGRWHKYTPQMEIFKKIGKDAGWEVTVMTGTHHDQVKKLHTPDFGKGYDVIVYNFCFAGERDLEAADNLMKQTREHGVPALLIHCSMHSWWATFKNGQAGSLGPDYKGKAKADPKLVEQWRVAHRGKPFPAWGDFTGVASGRHGPQQPVKMVTVAKDHPVTKRFPDGFKTPATELYNNIYVLDGVVPLIRGEQGNAKAVVVWTCPQGKSQVMGLTVGHGVDDWKSAPIQNLIIDGVNYLAENPKP
jgi:hypothetical protein